MGGLRYLPRGGTAVSPCTNAAQRLANRVRAPNWVRAPNRPHSALGDHITKRDTNVATPVVRAQLNAAGKRAHGDMSVEILFLAACALPTLLSVVVLDVQFFPNWTDDLLTDLTLATIATFAAYVALRVAYKGVAIASSGLPKGVQTTIVWSIAVGLLIGLFQQDEIAESFLNLVKQRFRDDARRWWAANETEFRGTAAYAVRVAAVLFLWQAVLFIFYSLTILPLRMLLGAISARVFGEATTKAEGQEMDTLEPGQLDRKAEDNQVQEDDAEVKTNPTLLKAE